MRQSRLLGILALLVIASARLAIPAAPAMYEGPIGPAEPYHYCSPPQNMATINKKPTGGSGDLPSTGDASQLGSVSTSDNQVLVFFPKGALKATGASRFHVAVDPGCSDLPAQLAGNRLVGNAYDLTVLGEPGDLPVTFVQNAQVLLRTPPLQYTSVEVYYSGSWHPTQWGQQGDIANVSLNHSGPIAAFDDGRVNAPGKPASAQTPWLLYATEAALLAVAVGIVVAAIFVSVRRGTAEAANSPDKAPHHRTKKPRKR